MNRTQTNLPNDKIDQHVEVTAGKGYGPDEWVAAVTRAIWRNALIIGVIVGSVYVLGRLKTVIVYLFVAAIFAYVMRPMATFIAQRGILVPRNKPMHTRRMLATLYVLALMFVGGYFSVKLTLSPFVGEIKDVTSKWDTVYKPRFDKYGEDFKNWYQQHIKQEWRDKIEQQLKGIGGGDAQKQATALVGDAARNVGGIAHNIVEIVLLPVLAFYFALDSKKLKHEAIGVLPRSKRREVARMIHGFNQIMHSFVVGQAILCALAGVVIGIFLAILGVPYALTLGLLAGFTRAIPIIGPIIGGIPIIILTLVTAGMPTALGVLAFFTFLHFAESKFVMPMLIGERMNLHPVAIIIVLLIGQEFGGLLGMFFAAPIASIIRVIVQRYWLQTHRLARHQAQNRLTTPSG